MTSKKQKYVNKDEFKREKRFHKLGEEAAVKNDE